MRRQYGRHPLRACSQTEGFRIGRIRRIFNIVFPCSYGGIGRRGRFRFCWATPVQVQVLLAAFFYSIKNGMAALSAQWPYRFLLFIMYNVFLSSIYLIISPDQVSFAVRVYLLSLSTGSASGKDSVQTHADQDAGRVDQDIPQLAGAAGHEKLMNLVTGCVQYPDNKRRDKRLHSPRSRG